ncbi:MAG: hypothetical protein WAO74_02655 [Polaribacter sp.]|uniref:NAD(P)/FAD-dependent oxidoreductase n=1 Tax=Polaribacter sp. TaxID=1920175 RepID=UPI003BAF1AC9
MHASNNVNLPIEEAINRPVFISYGKRWDFDYFLVNQFSEEFTTELFGNGVKNLEELQDGILITLKDDTKILSKIVVGADGINSIVSRKLGKNKPDKLKSSTFISSYFKNVENLPENNQGEIRICYHKIPLFFYIFPLIDNQVNVSLGGNTK